MNLNVNATLDLDLIGLGNGDRGDAVTAAVKDNVHGGVDVQVQVNVNGV